MTGCEYGTGEYLRAYGTGIFGKGPTVRDRSIFMGNLKRDQRLFLSFRHTGPPVILNVEYTGPQVISMWNFNGVKDYVEVLTYGPSIFTGLYAKIS